MATRPGRMDHALSSGATVDIAPLIENIDSIPRLIEISKQQAPGLDISKIIDRISKEVELSKDDLFGIFLSLENISYLEERFGGFSDVVKRLTRLVKPELARKIKERSADLNTAIRLYDKDNPISITFKAQRLTYLRERLFSSVEIITDARPVFNASGEFISEFVVTHNLVITSLVNNREQKEFYAVDDADLLSIRKACDRAFLKARTLKQALGERWPTEILKDAEPQS